MFSLCLFDTCHPRSPTANFRLEMALSVPPPPSPIDLTQPPLLQKHGLPLDVYLVWAQAILSNAGPFEQMRRCKGEIKGDDSNLPGDEGTGLESCHRATMEMTAVGPPRGMTRLSPPVTGGEWTLTQWVHCEFVVSFEAIRPVVTQQVCGEFF